MVIKIVWTKRALLHLKAELEYYGKIDHSLAKELTIEVNNSVKKIADMPGIGRPGKKISIREFILNKYPYVIVYRVRDDILEILAFIHQKRKNIQSFY